MLMNMQELLTIAQKHHFAIPAFNIGSLEIFNAVKEESDADILIMNEDLSLDTVIAMGVPMMRDGKILKKGTYEK